MTDSVPTTRQERLRELRARRQQMLPDAARKGMQGLWRDLDQSTTGSEQDLILLGRLKQDPALLQLVSDLLKQNGIGLKEKLKYHPDERPAIKDMGLELLGEEARLSTSSTTEEIARYRRAIENRADWLEACLEETLMELARVLKFGPVSGESSAQPEVALAAVGKTKKTGKSSR